MAKKIKILIIIFLDVISVIFILHKFLLISIPFTVIYSKHCQDKIMNQQQIKFFMPEEANRALLLIRQIVRDIHYKNFELRTIKISLGGNKAAIAKNSEIIKLGEDKKHFVEEIEELGCYFRPYSESVSLIDLPAIIDGEEVFLCWRSDEDSVKYYHSLNGGFNAREKIPEYYFRDSFEQVL